MSTEDSFAILGIPHCFDIDTKLLENRYLTLQAETILSNGEAAALEASSKLNEAYLTLKDDFKRAEVLLAMCGINLSDMRNSINSRILEKTMEEMTIVSSAQSLKALEDLLIKKNTERRNLYAALNKAFTQEQIQKAAQLSMEFKYTENVIQALKNKIKSFA